MPKLRNPVVGGEHNPPINHVQLVITGVVIGKDGAQTNVMVAPALIAPRFDMRSAEAVTYVVKIGQE
ncbi:MAG: hypothetical protein WA484_11460 [Solirubrobacteraceae bacterium]